METKLRELHKHLKSIDLSKFNLDKKYKIETPENVRKYSRYIGTEFDRTFKNILSQINQIDTFHLPRIWIKGNLFHEKKQLLPIKYLPGRDTKFSRDFEIEKFIKVYNFQKSLSYGIKNETDIKSCQKYLNELFLKIDFEKFKAKKILITDLKFEYGITGAKGNYGGYIDLIIDDKIIDIKTDGKINKIPNSYISQLLYYYIFVKYIVSASKEKNPGDYFSKLSINKVCMYYASFDLLLEFDMREIIPNEKSFFKLMHNELTFGNNRVREIVNNAVSNKKLDTECFRKIEFQIIQNRQNIFKSNFENLIITKDYEKARIVLKKLKNEFPKCNMTIVFPIYLNFLQNQYSIDQLKISKYQQTIIEYINSKTYECERILKYETEVLNKYFHEYHHILNSESFNESVKKCKLYSDYLNNLKYFKLYIDFYKNIKKHK